MFGYKKCGNGVAELVMLVAVILITSQIFLVYYVVENIWKDDIVSMKKIDWNYTIGYLVNYTVNFSNIQIRTKIIWKLTC